MKREEANPTVSKMEIVQTEEMTIGEALDKHLNGLHELLRMCDCPEILIKHPNILNGKPSEETMKWAREVAEKHIEEEKAGRAALIRGAEEILKTDFPNTYEHLKDTVHLETVKEAMLWHTTQFKSNPSSAKIAQVQKEHIMSEAKKYARYESGADKTGFIYLTQLEELLNSDQNGAVSDTTGGDSSTSAGNQTPSTETPSSSTKEEVERKLKIAIKALEKILQAQAIDGYIPTFKLPYSARIANDALSQINKGEPGK